MSLLDRSSWTPRRVVAGLGLSLIAALLVHAALRGREPSRGDEDAQPRVAAAAPTASATASAIAPATAPAMAVPPLRAPQAAPKADFAGERASRSVRRLVEWAVATGDHGGLPFFVIDKREARVLAFDGSGRAQGAAAALLGRARGDDSVPGIGERELSQILPHERTTPAGRFVAQAGRNLSGEDIVWIDYGAAVSMHRVRATVASERRLQRLASRTVVDNRISYGCVNLPVAFYDRVLRPLMLLGDGRAIVYVLPEKRSLHAVFGPLDAPGPARADAGARADASGRPDSSITRRPE